MWNSLKLVPVFNCHPKVYTHIPVDAEWQRVELQLEHSLSCSVERIIEIFQLDFCTYMWQACGLKQNAGEVELASMGLRWLLCKYSHQHLRREQVGRRECGQRLSPLLPLPLPLYSPHWPPHPHQAPPTPQCRAGSCQGWQSQCSSRCSQCCWEHSLQWSYECQQ